jgi:hypothetical protein
VQHSIITWNGVILVSKQTLSTLTDMEYYYQLHPHYLTILNTLFFFTQNYHMLVTMRLSLSIAVFTLVTYVTGLPSHHVIPRGEPQLPLLDPGMTIKEAARKCGDEAQLSCCGRAVKAGDVTSVDEGIGSGLLKSLAGGGSGISSILAFDQCSKLDAQSEQSNLISSTREMTNGRSRCAYCTCPESAEPALQAECGLLSEKPWRFGMYPALPVAVTPANGFSLHLVSLPVCRASLWDPSRKI